MMEGNKKIENIKATQAPINNGAKPLEQSNLEENKDLKILELEKKLEISNKLLHLIVHDLRTPLSNFVGILGFYAEEMQDMEKDEILKIMSVLSKESKKTFELLESLSDFAYLRNKEIKPEISKLNLLEQTKISIDSLLETAKKKQISINTSGIKEDVEVLADPKRLQIVIRNLCSNAIKFTNIGGNISIISEKVGNKIEVSFIDDGIGLSEKEMDKLFEKIGETRYGTNKEKGTGFGLNFCKDLVNEMNGTIRVESVEDHGAKFTISLPVVEDK